ncbi:hypothetical protein D3C73_1285910 [compost metagenome]
MHDRQLHIIRGYSSGVRSDDHILHLPQLTLQRQGLLGKYIQTGPGNHALFQRCDQLGLNDCLTPGQIQKDCRPLHRCKFRRTH